MNSLVDADRHERMNAATNIVDYDLPKPDYRRNFQVEYEREPLIEAVAENLGMPGVARPREIDGLSAMIAAVGEGSSNRPIVITNSCAEHVRLMEPIGDLAAKTLAELAVIDQSELDDPIAIQRVCGQFVKPRSRMMEAAPSGRRVFSYMGDGINGEAFGDRTPDPTRLVAGAVQSRALQEQLAATGSRVLAAHEALSLPYELPFLRTDPETGEDYLESAHLPWVGMRTNHVLTPQSKLVSTIKNAVGVKIGAMSDELHIDDIARSLNPRDLPGKIVFMLRLSEDQSEYLPRILRGIKDSAPEAAILYDIHGATRTREEDGKKIRVVGDIVQGIERLAYACG
ncbi:MAG: 3-deoxy-7-phosphoheptulonate synthase [Candidatus Saccharimonadales bacterium]